MKSAFGIVVPENLAESVDPNRCGLIIYDMQVGIVPQVPDGPQVLANCVRLLASARQANMRVFYTRHMFLPNHAAGTGQLRRAMIWQRKDDPAQTSPLMLRESASWQIVPEPRSAGGGCRYRQDHHVRVREHFPQSCLQRCSTERVYHRRHRNRGRH